MKPSKILRWFIKFAIALDRADISLLRIFSTKAKKTFVRKTLSLFPSAKLNKPLDVNGVRIYSPGSIIRQMSLVSVNDHIIRQMEHCLRPGMVVVDVGANIGYLTLFAARLVGPNGKVYAAEPMTDNLEYLKKNIQLNGFTNIEVLPYAAGSTRQAREFYIRNSSGQHSFFKEHNHGKVIKIIKVEEVPLDEVIKEHVDFVKIDVEGGEIEVLRGMKRILQSSSDLRLIVEWIPSIQQRAGHSAEDLPMLLLKEGFALSVIDEEKQSWVSLEEIRALVPELLNDPLRGVDLYADRKTNM